MRRGRGDSGARGVRVALVNLGCPKNLVDAEVMLGGALGRGMRLVSETREADVVIVNTCAFIEEAKEESIGAILDLAEAREEGGRPGQRIVVAGCLSQRYAGDLARLLPEVDAFVGLDQVGRVGEIVEGLMAGDAARGAVHVTAPPRAIPDLGTARFRLTPSHWMYVRVSEGCDHRCSFCAIPQIRGRQRSRPVESIVDEVRAMAGAGVKEFNLIGQDTTAYGRDQGRGAIDLAGLIERLEGVDGDFWIRLLYTHPARWDRRLMETVAASRKVARYVDIPFQHIDSGILRAMGRGTSTGRLEGLIDEMRARIPGIVLRTTFIVGFPGESEAAFERLLEFVGRARFDRAGVFAYSREEGTRAAALGGRVHPRTRLARVRRVMELQRRISREVGEAQVGRVLRVLADGAREGRGERDAPEIDGRILLDRDVVPGGFVQVRVTGATDYDLRGAIVGEDRCAGAPVLP